MGPLATDAPCIIKTYNKEVTYDLVYGFVLHLWADCLSFIPLVEEYYFISFNFKYIKIIMIHCNRNIDSNQDLLALPLCSLGEKTY